MSSKIKVDTIENVAGSGNVSLGSGHNLVVPGNTSISGDLTMGHDGAIINFGADSDVTLTHNHNTGLTLTGTGHTFSSNTYNVIKIQTDSNDDGSNDDAILQWTNGSSNTVKGEIRYDESESMFEIGAGDNQGHIKIDTNGHVLMPSQSAFLATSTSNQSNIAASTTVAVALNNEIFDQNGDFTVSTGDGQGGDGSNVKAIFTAPVGGKYQFNARAYLYQVPNNCSYIYVLLKTSNREYIDIIKGQAFDEEISYLSLNVAVLADMDANDTAHIEVYQAGGSATTDILGNGTHGHTSLSGYLVA